MSIVVFCVRVGTHGCVHRRVCAAACVIHGSLLHDRAFCDVMLLHRGSVSLLVKSLTRSPYDAEVPDVGPLFQSLSESQRQYDLKSHAHSVMLSV
jgi:hypothetical protein